MRRMTAWLAAVVTLAGLLVGAPTAHAAQLYSVGTTTADRCAQWGTTPPTGAFTVTHAGAAIVPSGTLRIAKVLGPTVSVPVTSNGTKAVTVALSAPLGRGVYEVTFTAGADSSPTFFLDVCQGEYTAGSVQRVTATTAQVTLTLPEPFNPSYPACFISPVFVDDVDTDWDSTDYAVVRNQTAASFQLVSPIDGPVAIPDRAELSGLVVCQTSRTATAPSIVLGYYTVAMSPLAPFVKAAYTDFLRRSPSTTEIANSVAALVNSSQGRVPFLRGLANSPEWLGVIVRSMYQDTLGRQPDAAGLATWIQWIRTGRFTVAQAAALFYSSDEFYLGQGGSNLTTWVTRLYQKLLGRAPDAAGLTAWVGYAANPAYGRSWVAGQFYQSLESRLTRVRNLYQSLLGRNPDPTGWPYWAGVILTSGDVELAVSLAASLEYDLRAQARFPG